MILSFYPLEIAKRHFEGQDVVLLFGRTLENRKIAVLDDSFWPHFYVIPKAPEEVESLLQTLRSLTVDVNGQPTKPRRCELVLRKLGSQAVVAVQVDVRSINEQFSFLSGIQGLEEVERVVEHDVDFLLKYTAVKQVSPCKLMTVEGEYINFKGKVSVFKVFKMKEQGTEQFKGYTCLSFHVKLVDGLKKQLPLSLDAPLLEVPLVRAKFSSPDRLIDDILVFDGTTFISCKGLEPGNSVSERNDEESDFAAKPADVRVIRAFIRLLEEIKPDFLFGFHSDIRDLPLLAARLDGLGERALPGLDTSPIRISTSRGLRAAITGMSHIDVTRLVALLTGIDPYSLHRAEFVISRTIQPVDIRSFERWLGEQKQEFDARGFLERTHKLAVSHLSRLIELSLLVSVFPHDLVRLGTAGIVEHYLNLQLPKNQLIPPRRKWRLEENPGKNPVQDGVDEYAVETGSGPSAGLSKDGFVIVFSDTYLKLIDALNISPDTLCCDCCRKEGSLWFCENKKGIYSKAVKDLLERRKRIDGMLKSMKESTLLEARRDAIVRVLSLFQTYVGYEGSRYGCPEAKTLLREESLSFMNGIKGSIKGQSKVVAHDPYRMIIEVPSHMSKTGLRDMITGYAGSDIEMEIIGRFPLLLFRKSQLHGLIRCAGTTADNVILEDWEYQRAKTVRVPLASQILHHLLGLLIVSSREKGATDAIAAGISFCKELVVSFKEGRVSGYDAAILARLKKNLDLYETITNHVEAGLKLRTMGCDVYPGMILPYTIISGPGTIKERIRPLSQVSEETIDGEYFLMNYILPVIQEVLEPFGIALEEIVDETQLSLETFFKRRKKHNW